MLLELGLDGCEVRLCGLCAFVRPRVPCVPCVSRLPPVSFYRCADTIPQPMASPLLVRPATTEFININVISEDGFVTSARQQHRTILETLSPCHHADDSRDYACGVHRNEVQAHLFN